jgi:hypothetical protein
MNANLHFSFKILMNFLCIIYFNILVFLKLFLTIKWDFMNKTPDLSEPNAVNIAYIAGTVFTVNNMCGCWSFALRNELCYG